jgi:hypothetical protein
MKLIILRLDSANKPSPMFEGVAEIRINSQPCKGIKLTIWNTQARRAPRVAIVHDAVKETIKAHLTLIHVFHTYGSANICVAHALSHCTPVRCGRIASISVAHDTTKFGDSMSRMHQYIQVLVHSDPTSVGLNRQRRGLPPWSSEFQIIALILLPIQYSLLSPNCPTRSPIMPIITQDLHR